MKFDDALQLLGIERGQTRDDAEKAFSSSVEDIVAQLDHADCSDPMSLQQQLINLTAAIEIVRLTLDDDPKALEIAPKTTVLEDVHPAATDDAVDALLEKQRKSRAVSAGTQFLADLPIEELKQKALGTMESHDDRETVNRDNSQPDDAADEQEQQVETAAPEEASSDQPLTSDPSGAADTSEAQSDADIGGEDASAGEPAVEAGDKDDAQSDGPDQESPAPPAASPAARQERPAVGHTSMMASVDLPPPAPAKDQAKKAQRKKSAPKPQPSEPPTGDQGWIDEPAGGRRGALKWVALLALASLSALGAWWLWNDDGAPVATPPSASSINPETNALVDRFIDAQSRLGGAVEKLDAQASKAAETREKLGSTLAKLEQRLDVADPDERDELETEVAQVRGELQRMQQHRDLVERFVTANLEPARALQGQPANQVGGTLESATIKVEQASETLAQRLAALSALNQAIASKQRFEEYLQAWLALGFRWPVDRDQLRGAVIAEDAWEDGYDRLADDLTRAEVLMAQGDFAQASALWSTSADTLAQALQNATEQQGRVGDRVLQLVALAETALAERRLTSPRGDNALEFFRQILEISPQNESAQRGFERIQLAYLDMIRAALDENDIDKALRYGARARTVALGTDALARVEGAIEGYYQAQNTAQANLVSQARRAISEGRLTDFANSIDALQRDFPDNAEVERLVQERDRALQSAGYRFVEFPGLSMVVIPSGAFEMGYSGRRFLGMGGASEELPRHPVKFDSPFALATHEITVALFRRFVEAKGHATSAERGSAGKVLTPSGVADARDRSWRLDYRGERATDALPAIHVSHDDATAFTRWLSEQTGETYRLPSESEHEYVQRANSMARFPWGNDGPSGIAGNFLGRNDPLPDGWNAFSSIMRRNAMEGYWDDHFGPAPVGSFEPNEFGIQDITGNVAEWTLDCFMDDYSGKDASGQARTIDGCPERVVRGSAWGMDAETLRISYRQGRPADYFDNLTGFRVVREL